MTHQASVTDMSIPAAPQEWWREDAGFFGRKYMEGDSSLEGYSSIPRTLYERTQREVEGVIRLLDLQPNQRILDCPCGYGRHSIGLAERGFQVVGVDINNEELQVAREESAHLQNVHFIEQDMRYLNCTNQFDAVLNLFFSFGFFDSEEENLQVLQRFHDALNSGGEFLMHTDVNVPRILSGKYKLRERRTLQSGKELRISEVYDPTRRRLCGRWTLIGPNGDSEQLTDYSMRVYTYDEFAGLCRSVGFRHVKGYGGWARAPLTDDSEDMIVVAEK